MFYINQVVILIIVYLILSYGNEVSQHRAYNWDRLYDLDNNYNHEYHEYYDAIVKVTDGNGNRNDSITCAGLLVSITFIITSLFCPLNFKQRVHISTINCLTNCEHQMATPLFFSDNINEVGCNEIALLVLPEPFKRKKSFVTLPFGKYQGDLALHFQYCIRLVIEEDDENSDGISINYKVRTVRDSLVKKEIFCLTNLVNSTCLMEDCANDTNAFAYTENEELQYCLEYVGSPLMCIEDGQLMLLGIDTIGCLKDARSHAFTSFYRIDNIITWLNEIISKYMSLNFC